MIDFNGRQLDLTEGNDEVTKLVLKKMREIQDYYEFPVAVKIVDDLGHRPDPIGRPGHVDFPTLGIGLSVNAPPQLRSSIGAEKWTYYNHATERGGKEIRLPKRLMISSRKLIFEDDIDLLFFLLYCSPNVKNTWNKKLEKRGRKTLEVIDPKQKAKKSINRNRKRVKAESILLNEEVDENTVMRIARMYGVPDTDKKEVDEVIYDVHDVLKITEQWDDFVDKYDKYKGEDFIDLDELREAIQKAIDKGVIIKSGSARGQIYSWAGEDGGRKGSKKLCNDDIEGYMQAHPDVFRELKSKA